MDDARALLNSLMGADRDARPEQRRDRKFTDEDICKNYLLGLCPHDLFPNTKIDLGPCSKHHNEHFKEEFEASSDCARYRRKWRRSLCSQLQRLLDDLDKRIRTNQLRIQAEKEGVSQPKEQKLTGLKDKLAERLREAEDAADEGRFEDSRKIMADTDTTQQRIEDIETKKFQKYKIENICEVCGLIIDAEEAEDMKSGRGWHINGKQHLGYAMVREKIKALDEQEAKDKKDGVKSPSPSPVKVKPPSTDNKRQRRNRSKSQKRRAEGTKRKNSTSKSPGRGRNNENNRRRGSPSWSRGRRQKTDHRRRDVRQHRSSTRSRSLKRRERLRRRSRSRQGKRNERRSSSHDRRRERNPRKSARNVSESGSRKARASDEEADVPKPPPEDAEPPRPPPDEEPPRPPSDDEPPVPSKESPPQPESPEREPSPEPAKPLPPVKFFLGLGKRR